MTQSPIEVILFDLGNVILPFNHYQIAEKLSRFSQHPGHPNHDWIFSFLFNFETGAINRYEVGEINSLDFFQSLKETLRLSLSYEQFVPIWTDIFWENEEVSDLIRSFKGKKRLGLLSNTNPLHFEYAVSTFPIVRIFDRWILSHEVGFKKPAVEIFQKAMEWASVQPGRILFIDDIRTHVEAGTSLGIQGIHFQSAAQLKEELAVKLGA